MTVSRDDDAAPPMLVAGSTRRIIPRCICVPEPQPSSSARGKSRWSMSSTRLSAATGLVVHRRRRVHARCAPGANVGPADHARPRPHPETGLGSGRRRRLPEMWLRHHGFFSMNIATTRGCPYHCNWCAKPIYGQRYRRSPGKPSPGRRLAEVDLCSRSPVGDRRHFRAEARLDRRVRIGGLPNATLSCRSSA